MIGLQAVIDLLTPTGYSIELSVSPEVNLQELAELPTIYLGYASIQAKNPNAAIAFDIYSTHGEDITQTFDIHIVTLVEDLPAVWQAVYTALVGKTPISIVSSPASVSGFTYAQGGVLGLSNGRIWHLDKYVIGLPTDNVLF